MGRGMFDFPFNPKKCKIMKFANISKATRVPASLKFAALAAILLVPASAFAETDPDRNVQSQTKSTVRPQPFNPDAKKPLRNSISFKAFYGLGLEPPIRNSSLSEVNISGLTFEYARSLSENLEFVVASNIGYGSRDYGRWEVFACSVSSLCFTLRSVMNQHPYFPSHGNSSHTNKFLLFPTVLPVFRQPRTRPPADSAARRTGEAGQRRRVRRQGSIPASAHGDGMCRGVRACVASRRQGAQPPVRCRRSLRADPKATG